MKTRYFLPLLILLVSFGAFADLIWLHPTDSYNMNQVIGVLILLGGAILSILIFTLSWFVEEIMKK